MSAIHLRRNLLGILASVLIAGLPVASMAEDNGAKILEISGNVETTDGTQTQSFTRAELESIGSHVIVTDTPWWENPVTFSGVLVRDLLNEVGASGMTVQAFALNDYSVEIPMSDFDDYNVILALKKDDQYLTIRDRGPIWIIYPWSDVNTLQNELYYSCNSQAPCPIGLRGFVPSEPCDDLRW